MKKNNNKTQITNTVDALINDYNNNKESYNNIINSKSISHQYFEGIYLKYSKSLEEYMKKNKKSLKLTGSKKFMNVPIDIFLKESKLYKEEILNELKNKNKKSKITTDKIFLTPLPDKPRVLLNTEKEKNEFLFAERQAVVMRTFEYTNALRNKGLNQYYQMKENEKQEMIYIMKKASNIIQNWWNSIKGKIRLEKKFKVKSINLCNLFKNFMNKKKKKYFKDIIRKIIIYNKIKEGKKFKDLIIQKFILNVISNQNNVIRYKIINRNWEFYTRKQYLNYNVNEKLIKLKKGNLNLFYNMNNPYISKIIMIQRNFRKIKNKKLLFSNIEKEKNIKLKNLIKGKNLKDKIIISKFLLKWFQKIHFYSSKRNILSTSLYNKQNKQNTFIPTYLSYLPILLLSKFKSRYQFLFSGLKERKNQKYKIEQLKLILKKINLKIILNKLNIYSKKNILLKAIINADKQGKKWKYFQFWNLRNILIHIFVSKLIKFAFSFSKHVFFRNIIIYTKNPPIDDSKNINYISNNNNKESYFSKSQNVNQNNYNFIIQNVHNNLKKK